LTHWFFERTEDSDDKGVLNHLSSIQSHSDGICDPVILLSTLYDRKK
jgi:hypothetical protein